MSDGQKPQHEARNAPTTGDTPPLFFVLVALLFAESALMLGVFLWLLFEVVTVTPVSYPSAVAIIVLAAVGAIWTAAIAIHTWKRNSWARAGALTWQILQIAVAVGSFQGAYARADIGWALLAPSLVVLALLFTPSIMAVRNARP